MKSTGLVIVPILPYREMVKRFEPLLVPYACEQSQDAQRLLERDHRRAEHGQISDSVGFESIARSTFFVGLSV